MSNWHKWPDEKPAKKELYLVLHEHGDYYLAICLDDGWYCEDIDLDITITHWMELPELPEALNE